MIVKPGSGSRGLTGRANCLIEYLATINLAPVVSFRRDALHRAISKDHTHHRNVFDRERKLTP